MHPLASPDQELAIASPNQDQEHAGASQVKNRPVSNRYGFKEYCPTSRPKGETDATIQAHIKVNLVKIRGFVMMGEIPLI